jgi:hypothetical protein
MSAVKPELARALSFGRRSWCAATIAYGAELDRLWQADLSFAAWVGHLDSFDQAHRDFPVPQPAPPPPPWEDCPPTLRSSGVVAVLRTMGTAPSSQPKAKPKRPKPKPKAPPKRGGRR